MILKFVRVLLDRDGGLITIFGRYLKTRGEEKGFILTTPMILVLYVFRKSDLDLEVVNAKWQEPEKSIGRLKSLIGHLLPCKYPSPAVLRKNFERFV